MTGTLSWTNILLWKITIFDGKIHYFDWAIFNCYVSLPGGMMVQTCSNMMVERGIYDGYDWLVWWFKHVPRKWWLMMVEKGIEAPRLGWNMLKPSKAKMKNGISNQTYQAILEWKPFSHPGDRLCSHGCSVAWGCNMFFHHICLLNVMNAWWNSFHHLPPNTE